MIEFESLLRRHAWEIGFAVEELRKVVEAHALNDHHGDRLQSLVTVRDTIGPDGSGPQMVCAQWVTARLDFRCSLISTNVISGDTHSGFTYRGPRWEVRRNLYDREPVFAGQPAIVLLWALALELDERGSTFTGEQVCRECSGRGEVLADGNKRYPSTHLIKYWPWPKQPHEAIRGASVQPCTSCDTGPKRPDTVSLAWLVKKLAAAEPMRAELGAWPGAWQAQLDEWLATGETHWRVQWWLAFAEWCNSGKVPDEHQLARLLAMRIPELLERIEAARRRAPR